MISTAVVIATGATIKTSKVIQDRPRAMLPALGKPMIVRVMSQLYRAGLRKFIVVVGINEGAVAAYLKKQWVPDAEVEFVLKSEKDMLGSLIATIAKKLTEPFLITSYNTFTHETFAESLIKFSLDHPDDLVLSGARMALNKNRENYNYAILNDGEIQIISDITNQSNYTPLCDIAVCGTSPREYLSKLTSNSTMNSFSELVLAYSMSSSAKLSMAETSWCLQVETDSDLLTLNRRLLQDTNDAHILSELPYTAKIIPPVRIDPQVSVGQGAIIGPNVYLERGSQIGYGVTIRDTLVLANGVVKAGDTIENSIIARSNVFKEE